MNCNQITDAVILNSLLPLLSQLSSLSPPQHICPLFKDFVKDWLVENRVAWKRSYYATNEITCRRYLIPHFGDLEVSKITKANILQFRASLANVPNGKRSGLSPDRINHITTSLKGILSEAASRFGFKDQTDGISALHVPKTKIDPFSLDEVKMILANVRPDFKNYFTVRFFTGMRTAEIDGLKWEYVDFEKRIISVRETLVEGVEETPKTAESDRDIQMSSVVHDTLKSQFLVTGNNSEFVFQSAQGHTINRRNLMRRVWYPLLNSLNLKKRKPYQTRHTAATLWLASGENPEWIARQMGHANTRMLFTVYSRYVPNLTRNDGTAFEKLLAEKM